jgi:hypothetical protein
MFGGFSAGMTSKRPFAAAALLLLASAQRAFAAPEPLVVTQLPDPDPNFVPPPPKPKHRAKAHHASSDEHPTLEQAFENLGRVAGQVAGVAEQRARAQAGSNAQMPDIQAEARAALERMGQSAGASRN